MNKRYINLDNFDRVIAQQWTGYNTSTGADTTDVLHINHGYDRDSNRTYADNQTQPTNSRPYAYDNLNRFDYGQERAA